MAASMTQATFKSAFFDRLKGPGGYYNIGNAFGFGVGLAVAVAAAEHGSDISTAVTVAKDYVAGSPAAVALTTATGVFFWGGEEYHRAWVNGFPPDARRGIVARWQSVAGSDFGLPARGGQIRQRPRYQENLQAGGPLDQHGGCLPRLCPA
jgi:hypothetical protein